MRILVTGAGGFIGKALSLKLNREGYQVLGLARGDYKEMREAGIEMIRADITNLDSIAPHFKNVDACFHVASKVAMWGRWQEFYQINVQGAMNVLTACLSNKVPRLIYTSTPSVVFGNQSIESGDEGLPYPSKYYSFYARSKALAEKYILKANNQGIKTLALRPHLVFGPGDKNLIPKLVELGSKGRLKIIGDGNNLVDVTYIENVVEAHRLALLKLMQGDPVDGLAYFIGQGPVNLWSFINKVLHRFEISPVQKKTSFNIAYFMGGVLEKIFPNPPMTRFIALQMSKSHYFSHERAEKLLGWHPKVSLADAIERL